MITERDVTQAEERERQLADTYLKGVADFAKWTSTVAIGATVWIVNALTSMTTWPLWLALGAVFSLLASLVVAVLGVRRTLSAWATLWAVAIDTHSFYVLKKLKAFEPSKVSGEKELEMINRLLRSSESTWPYTEPGGFGRWVTWHLVLLIMGLLFYAVAQLLSMP